MTWGEMADLHSVKYGVVQVHKDPRRWEPRNLALVVECPEQRLFRIKWARRRSSRLTGYLSEADRTVVDALQKEWESLASELSAGFLFAKSNLIDEVRRHMGGKLSFAGPYTALTPRPSEEFERLAKVFIPSPEPREDSAGVLTAETLVRLAKGRGWEQRGVIVRHGYSFEHPSWLRTFKFNLYCEFGDRRGVVDLATILNGSESECITALCAPLVKLSIVSTVVQAAYLVVLVKRGVQPRIEPLDLPVNVQQAKVEQWEIENVERQPVVRGGVEGQLIDKLEEDLHIS